MDGPSTLGVCRTFPSGEPAITAHLSPGSTSNSTNDCWCRFSRISHAVFSPHGGETQPLRRTLTIPRSYISTDGAARRQLRDSKNSRSAGITSRLVGKEPNENRVDQAAANGWRMRTGGGRVAAANGRRVLRRVTTSGRPTGGSRWIAAGGGPGQRTTPPQMLIRLTGEHRGRKPISSLPKVDCQEDRNRSSGMSSLVTDCRVVCSDDHGKVTLPGRI